MTQAQLQPNISVPHSGLRRQSFRASKHSAIGTNTVCSQASANLRGFAIPGEQFMRRELLEHTATLLLLRSLAPQEVQAIVPAQAGDRPGLARYIKKKKLDPLENYVPAVVAARRQLTRAGALMKDDLQEARELLRIGAFAGLRDNIKALGDYAQQGGIKDATKLVDSFFLAVQGFDYTLFQAKRNNTPVKDDSEAALQKTLGALDTLLATVPQSIRDDSEKVVEAIEESSRAQPAAATESNDPQLDQLIQLVPGTGG